MSDLAARIKQRMNDLGMSQGDLAKAIGYSQPAVSKILKGKTLEPKRIAQIAKALKTDVESLTGKGPMRADILNAPITASERSEFEPGPDLPEKFRRIPVVGTAQLGPEGYWNETAYPAGRGDGYVEFVSRDPNVYALRVRGDSMSPTIKSGWIIVVEPNTECVPGDYVVLCTKDERCMCKELLFERNGEFAFASVNELYGRITLTTEEINRLHRVSAIMPPGNFRHW